MYFEAYNQLHEGGHKSNYSILEGLNARGERNSENDMNFVYITICKKQMILNSTE